MYIYNFILEIIMEMFKELNDKKILIIGGGGFIGHNLAISLKDNNANVEIVDGLQVNNLGFYSNSYLDNPYSKLYINFINERLQILREKNIKMHIQDARDYHAISKIVADTNPNVIIHLAAIAHANRSNKDPYSTFDHSLRTLENVLDNVKERKIHLIFLSSSMVYGDFKVKRVSENEVCNPLGIYGALKLSAEKLIIGYNQVFDLPYTIIRPSALYGERCVSKRVGQAFIENALMKLDLQINGNGEDALDFTYIDDLIQGIKLSIINEKAVNEIFNITYGDARKIIDMADMVIKNFPDTKINFNPRDRLMPERGTLSITKANKLLGYQPKFPLEKGYLNYINWYKSFSNKYSDFFKS